jgi:hypothetical protein
VQRSQNLCACGCGLTTLYGRGNKPRKFIAGHESGKFAPQKQRKARTSKPPTFKPICPLCACGCGHSVKHPTHRFLAFHHLKSGVNHHAYLHGMSGTPEHCAYANAIRRCNPDPEGLCFPFYAAKGVKFLFKNFAEFYAELGPRPGPEYSVDRINPAGNYEKGNVRWETRDVQARNKRGQWFVWRVEVLSDFDNDLMPGEVRYRCHATWVCPVNA